MRKSWCLVGLMVVALGPWVRGETLRGTAVAEGGVPAAGAKVWAVKLWIQKLDRIETKADDKGGFAFDLPPGQWLIDATLGDQGVATMGFVTVAGGQILKPISLNLKREGQLRVKMVEAETGKPIKDARLVLDNGLVPTTNAEGRFEVGGITRARYHEAYVNAPGRERKRVLFEMSEKPVTDLEITCPRGGKVIGRVLDVDGKPIAGAFVGRSTSGSTIALSGLWARADDQGKYEFDGLILDRTTWLNVVAEGYENQQRDSVRADFGSGPVTIDFRLTKNPAAPQAGTIGTKPKAAQAKVANRRDITGVVLDPDKKPVVNATVRWGLNRSDDSLETKTGADGRFRIAFAPDQQGVLAVVPEQTELAPEMPSVESGGDHDVNVQLAKAHTVKGVVADDRGTSFVGVMVLPIVGGEGPGRKGLALWERSVKTDAQGRFQLLGLPAAGTSFTFLGDGVSDLRDHPLDFDKDNKVLMSSAGAIRGVVVDLDGKPVRNFRVLLNISREKKPGDKYGGFFAGFSGIGLTYSSDDGTFLIRNLGAGSVQRVTILAPGYAEGTLDRVIAEPLNHLNADKPLKFWVGKPYTLKVHAVEEGSVKPIPNAIVLLVQGDETMDAHPNWNNPASGWNDSVYARTDVRGVADFSPLSFSEGMLLVQAPGYSRAHAGWRDSSENVNIILNPEAVITGEVFDATTGKSPENVSIDVSSAFNGVLTASVSPGEAGRFRIDGLPAGSYALSIRTKTYQQLHRETIMLKAGEKVSRTIRVSPGAVPPR